MTRPAKKLPGPFFRPKFGVELDWNNRIIKLKGNAKHADLRLGDIVTSVEGHELGNSMLAEVMAQNKLTKLGWVRLSVRRNTSASVWQPPYAKAVGKNGFAVFNVTDDGPLGLELHQSRGRLVIDGVRPGSLAERLGMPEGAQIVSVNGEPLYGAVTAGQQFQRAVATAERPLRIGVEHTRRSRDHSNTAAVLPALSIGSTNQLEALGEKKRVAWKAELETESDTSRSSTSRSQGALSSTSSWADDIDDEMSA